MEIDSRYRRLLPTRRKVIQGLSTRSTQLIRPTSGEGGWDTVCSNCLNQFEWSLWRNWAGFSFASKGTCYVSWLIVSLNDALMTGCLDVYHDHISSINYYFVRLADFCLQDWFFFFFFLVLVICTNSSAKLVFFSRRFKEKSRSTSVVPITINLWSKHSNFVRFQR